MDRYQDAARRMGSDMLALRQHMRNLEATNTLLRRDVELAHGRHANFSAPASLAPVAVAPMGPFLHPVHFIFY